MAQEELGMPLNTYKWGISEALNTLTGFSLLVIPIKGMVIFLAP